MKNKVIPLVGDNPDEQQDMTSGYEEGADSYVSKPVNFDEFLEAARSSGSTGRCSTRGLPDGLTSRRHD